jgi:DNA-binding CsgD family transcriptional regulator
VLGGAKKKSPARAPLNEALAGYTTAGANLFADASERELSRISGRAASSGDLTSSERRVAELVAEGHTNRQVAVALFVSERTADGHLSRVYA